MTNLSTMFLLIYILAPALILLLGAYILFFEMELRRVESTVNEREENK